LNQVTQSLDLAYPNPFGKDGFWFQSQQGGLLEIMDALGKPIWRKIMLPKEVVHLESVLFKNAGIYYWKTDQTSGKILYIP
jgi:hypothetical protein